METETFTSTSTNQIYKIIHEFNCNESSLISLLKCKICRKQYVGQTVDIFHSRRNNYKSNDRRYFVGDSCMQEHIREHFNGEGDTDFSKNASVTFVDKTGSQKSEKRKGHWIHTLKSMVSLSLNILISVSATRLSNTF